jgi:hypothetical protein
MQELLESHNAYNMSTLEMMTPPPKRCWGIHGRKRWSMEWEKKFQSIRTKQKQTLGSYQSNTHLLSD